MNDISLKQLEIFVAVVEYGGFTVRRRSCSSTSPP